MKYKNKIKGMKCLIEKGDLRNLRGKKANFGMEYSHPFSASKGVSPNPKVMNSKLKSKMKLKGGKKSY